MHSVGRSALAWSAACFVSFGVASARQDNLLLVIADDLGVDRVGAYAEHPDPGRTPIIDGLAQDGVLFRNAWSNPNCSPTRATVLTGRYSFRTGVGYQIDPRLTGDGLSPDEVALPQVLPDEYSSVLVGKWHLATRGQWAPHALDLGFDHQIGAPANLGWMAPGESYFHFVKWADGGTTTTSTYATTDTVDDAIRYVQDLPEPWLLVVSFNAPHAPFHAPPDHLHSFDLSGPPVGDMIGHYKAAIEALDTEFGRLLEVVDTTTTTVAFMGDNGTLGLAADAPFDPERAKGTVFEGGVNVPLIVAGASVPATGTECEALVNTTDLFATFAELAGGSSVADDSVSLVPYLSRPDLPSIRQSVYAERFFPNGTGPYLLYDRAIRGRRYKLIERQGEPDLFYDLLLDPFENDDLLTGPPMTDMQIEGYERLKGLMATLRDS